LHYPPDPHDGKAGPPEGATALENPKSRIISPDMTKALRVAQGGADGDGIQGIGGQFPMIPARN
jgi:hypothetical protein